MCIRDSLNGVSFSLRKGEILGFVGPNGAGKSTTIKHLGERIDIHGGGNDLIFPHHENEIAQTESYTCLLYTSRCV